MDLLRIGSSSIGERVKPEENSLEGREEERGKEII